MLFSLPVASFLTQYFPGAGYDQCNIPDCTAAGIRVSNVPTVVDAATADTGIFLMLGALRGFNVGLQNLRKGAWRGSPAPPLGHDPEGKLLGILGMGGIGRDMKKKAEALGMRVQYHNRKELDGELSGGAKYVSFEELLATSDVISLNLPLNVSATLPHAFRLFRTPFPPTDSLAERNSPHNIAPAIPTNERRRRNSEHCPWPRHGRGRPRHSPRLWQSILGRPRCV